MSNMVNVILSGTEENFEMVAVANEIADDDVKQISVEEFKEYTQYIRLHMKWQDRIIDLFDALS
jgi:hypothetical protein